LLVPRYYYPYPLWEKRFWEWKVVDGEMIAVVAKHEPITFTPGLKKEKN
jgi:hypothetical protein